MVLGAAVVALMAIACTNETEEQKIESEAYIQTVEVKGDKKNCAVVLQAQQGTSYSITLKSEDNWARFSNQLTSVEGVMENENKIVYIYFEKNASGVSRSANVTVSFSDGNSYDLSFVHHSYDHSVAFERQWAELPICKVEDNFIYNTYYGTMGVKSNARNYTYCFDPDYRAALWVAYPLHSCYTTGGGDRDNSDFGYDPAVDPKYQANLGAGSYSGRYDRGHQLPAADRKCSQQMMDQTFFATNMTPQWYSFNQKKWGSLEGKVRGMMCHDTLYVVTGAYFGGEHHSSIAKQTTDRSGNICPTPTHYYKALLRTKRGSTGRAISSFTNAEELRAIVFWLQHADTGSDTSISKADCISVEELERRTGFTFFPMLDDAIEEKVKSTITPAEWGVY